MADENVKLTADEQKYFDTQGAEAPAVEPKGAEDEKPAEVVVEKPAKAAKSKAKTAEAESAPEQEPADAPEKVAKDPKDEQIENLNRALRESREEGKRERQTVETRLQALQDVLLAKQKPQEQAVVEEMPDPDKDAIGALKYLLKKQNEIKAFQGQTQQEQERQTAVKGIMGEAGRQESEFLKAQPDYDATTGVSQTYNEASSFLLQQRAAELRALGYDQRRVQKTVTDEAIGLAASALQNKQNPAEVVLNLAKARGWAPKAKEAPAETETEKLARIAKGQDQSFSIGQAAGSKAPNNSKLDAKTLANMSESDFTAFMEKAKKSDLRQMMGD